MENGGKRNSVTPSRLFSLFEESSDQRPTQPVITKNANVQYSTQALLPGENVILQQDNVTCVGTLSNLATGLLYLTNYRLVFNGTFCHDSSSDGKSNQLDQDEMARRGYKFQKKRYQLPKVNKKLKKNISFIGKSVKKTGRSIQSSFKKGRDHVFYNRYNLEEEVAEIDTEPEETKIDLLSMRLGAHLTLQKRDSADSDSDDGAFGDCLQNVSISLPVASIHDVKKFPKQYLDKEKLMMLRDGIEVVCNNLTTVKFCIGGSDNYDVDQLLPLLEEHCKIENVNKAFAYTYAASLKIPSSCHAILEDRTAQNFYQFSDEVRRLKLDQTHHLATIEQRCCPRYPISVIVPSCVRDKEELRKLADYHCNSCFPIVTWKSPRSGGYLLRSGIPRTSRGQSDARCETDERLINELGNLTSNRDAKVWIFTERSKIPVPSTNNEKSGLTVAEGEAYYYPHCSFVNDDNLPDVQTVQQSGLKLMNAFSSKVDDSKYLSQLEDSGWLEQVRKLLEISSAIASLIENDKSTVVVAYDTGVDRTSQVVSLVQLLLDRFYRTTDGFQVLIQKEWLSIRHPFVSRNLTANAIDDELSPIFLQFLDCVWQLFQQCPTLFQFNEHLLETLANHAYSGRFGTFLDLESSGFGPNEPVSIWTWLNIVSLARDDFSNSNYDDSENIGPIYPVISAPWLQIWTWHYRYKTEENLVLADGVACMQLEKLQRNYKEKLEEYRSLLERLSDIDASYASQYAFHTRTGSTMLYHRSESCATNYSYHLDTNDESKRKNLLASLFMKKAKSLDDLLSMKTSKQEKVGKSTFYNDTEEDISPNKIGTFPRSGRLMKSPKNLRTVLHEKGIKFIGVSEVKITEHTCSGYLVKQGKVRKSWRRRWFVLDVRKGCVAYFENHVCDQPKGVFKCMAIMRVQEHRHQDKYPNLFMIETVDRTYSIEAPNVTALKSARKSLLSGNQPLGIVRLAQIDFNTVKSLEWTQDMDQQPTKAA